MISGRCVDNRLGWHGKKQGNQLRGDCNSQARVGGFLDQSGSSRGGEKWSCFSISKVEWIGYAE